MYLFCAPLEECGCMDSWVGCIMEDTGYGGFNTHTNTHMFSLAFFCMFCMLSCISLSLDFLVSSECSILADSPNAASLTIRTSCWGEGPPVYLTDPTRWSVTLLNLPFSPFSHKLHHDTSSNPNVSSLITIDTIKWENDDGKLFSTTRILFYYILY